MRDGLRTIQIAQSARCREFADIEKLLLRMYVVYLR